MKMEQVQEQAQKKLEDFQSSVSNLMDRAKPMSEDMIHRSKKLYQDALNRLPENSDKYAAFAAAGIAIGFIGFQLGKKRRKSESIMEKISEAPSELKNRVAPAITDYFAPALKVAKLWLFYRLSV